MSVNESNSGKFLIYFSFHTKLELPVYHFKCRVTHHYKWLARFRIWNLPPLHMGVRIPRGDKFSWWKNGGIFLWTHNINLCFEMKRRFQVISWNFRIARVCLSAFLHIAAAIYLVCQILSLQVKRSRTGDVCQALAECWTNVRDVVPAFNRLRAR